MAQDPTIRIQGKHFVSLPKEANIAPMIQEIVLTAKKNKLSFNAVKIILLLTANLKDKQIKKNQKDQLDLFDDEWFKIDSENAFNVQLAFRFSDFLPKGNKNYNQVKAGIDELQEFNQTIEFQKMDKSGKVRQYKLKSAFISSYILEEGYGFKMTINNYWYRTLVNITERFNPYLKSIIFNLSFNSLTFYFYLKSLPHIRGKDYEDMLDKIGASANKITGTIIKIENFLKIFDSNFKYESDIKRKLLEPIRNDLNKFSEFPLIIRLRAGKLK